MSANGADAVLVLDRARAGVVARLRRRSAELGDAVFAGVREVVADPAADGNSELVEGLRPAIAASIELGLASIEAGGPWSGSIPTEAIAQARRAARAGVSLNTLIGRYIAGHEVLSDRVMQEVARSKLSDQQRMLLLRQASEAQLSLLRSLMQAVTDEYTRELERATRSREQRRTELVQGVLSGAVASADALGYELDAVHVGVIATGACADEALRQLAVGTGRELVSVSRGDGTVWAWLGGGGELPRSALDALCGSDELSGVALALGEPIAGPAGFRLTHRQALAARQVAERHPARITRYSDLPLVAFVLQDEAIAARLVEAYLHRLDAGRADGIMLRRTLRAYLAAGQNAASAAAALGVNRRTVGHRLVTAERYLGRTIRDSHAELEVALRLEELLDPPY